MRQVWYMKSSAFWIKAIPKSLQRRNSWPGKAKRTAEPCEIEIGVPIIQTPNLSCTYLLGSDRIGSVPEKFDLNPGAQISFFKCRAQITKLGHYTVYFFYHMLYKNILNELCIFSSLNRLRLCLNIGILRL